MSKPLTKERPVTQLRKMPLNELQEWYQECSAESIALTMGLARTTVQQIIRERGIIKRPGHPEHIKQAVLQKAKTTPVKELTKETGIDHKTIRGWIKKESIKANTEA